MTARKIIYFILIIISVMFYILFLEDLSFYLLIFILALPLFLATVLMIGKFNIKCTLSSEYKTSLKNNKCKFFLNIRNKSIFPFPISVIIIEYSNKLSGTANKMYISVPIHPHKSQTVSFALSSDYCGVMNVKITSIRLYDYIKLFSCKVKVMKETDIYVIPEATSDILKKERKTIYADDSEKFSRIKSGDDPSEIFELKDYSPGDKLSRIHWNLSSKQNQLITKHYSQCISSPVTVIPDFDFYTPLTELDGVLEFFYGLSFILSENEITHKIHLTGISEEIIVSDYDTLNNCYIDILKRRENIALNKEDILSASEGQSEIYIITNKKRDDYQIPENIISGETYYIFISDEFKKADFMQADNLKIAQLPVYAVAEYLERILL